MGSLELVVQLAERPERRPGRFALRVEAVAPVAIDVLEARWREVAEQFVGTPLR